MKPKNTEISTRSRSRGRTPKQDLQKTDPHTLEEQVTAPTLPSPTEGESLPANNQNKNPAGQTQAIFSKSDTLSLELQTEKAGAANTDPIQDDNDLKEVSKPRIPG